MPIIVLIISFVVEGMLLIFHVSVALCVFQQVWKGVPSFRGGFYNLFLIQSVADVVSYATVSVLLRREFRQSETEFATKAWTVIT